MDGWMDGGMEGWKRDLNDSEVLSADGETEVGSLTQKPGVRASKNGNHCQSSADHRQ